MAILLGAIWGFALIDPVDASGTLIYLILPVFLTSLLLGPRATAVVSAAVLAEPGVTLDTEPLPPVLAEPSMLRRVLVELVDNAVTHRDGDTARIEIRGRRDGDRVVLTVADDGPGIPPGARDRVLELFQRLDRSDPERTGLGLALSRRIVEILGGTMRIGEADGGGTLVEIELPAGGGGFLEEE